MVDGQETGRSLLVTSEMAQSSRTFFRWQARKDYAGNDVSSEFFGYRNDTFYIGSYAEVLPFFFLLLTTNVANSECGTVDIFTCLARRLRGHIPLPLVHGSLHLASFYSLLHQNQSLLDSCQG